MPLESQHGSYRRTGVFIVAQVFYPSVVREIDVTIPCGRGLCCYLYSVARISEQYLVGEADLLHGAVHQGRHSAHLHPGQASFPVSGPYIGLVKLQAGKIADGVQQLASCRHKPACCHAFRRTSDLIFKDAYGLEAAIISGFDIGCSLSDEQVVVRVAFYVGYGQAVKFLRVRKLGDVGKAYFGLIPLEIASRVVVVPAVVSAISGSLCSKNQSMGCPSECFFFTVADSFRVDLAYKPYYIGGAYFGCRSVRMPERPLRGGFRPRGRSRLSGDCAL